jgi:hypothetical protein
MLAPFVDRPASLFVFFSLLLYLLLNLLLAARVDRPTTLFHVLREKNARPALLSQLAQPPLIPV